MFDFLRKLRLVFFWRDDDCRSYCCWYALTPEGITMFCDLFKLSLTLRLRVPVLLCWTALAWLTPTGGIRVTLLPIGDREDEFCCIVLDLVRA